MMNKYLFLDIDGVLNHDEWFESDGYKRNKSDWTISMFDPNCVARVNKILETTGAELVVSSSWRTMTDLPDIFRNVGLPDKFSVTPDLHKINTDDLNEFIWDYPDVPRGREIKDWLEKHAETPYTYCIIDDDRDMLAEQWPFFINTCADRISKHGQRMFKENEGSGLTDKCVEKAIKILNDENISKSN